MPALAVPPALSLEEEWTEPRIRMKSLCLVHISKVQGQKQTQRAVFLAVLEVAAICFEFVNTVRSNVLMILLNEDHMTALD